MDELNDDGYESALRAEREIERFNKLDKYVVDGLPYVASWFASVFEIRDSRLYHYTHKSFGAWWNSRADSFQLGYLLKFLDGKRNDFIRTGRPKLVKETLPDDPPPSADQDIIDEWGEPTTEKPKPSLEAKSPPAELVTPPASTYIRKYGVPLIPEVAGSLDLAREYDDIERTLRMTMHQIKELKKKPVGYFFEASIACTALQNAIEALKAGRPFWPCPYCGQQGCAKNKGCHGNKWISQMVFKIWKKQSEPEKPK